MSRKIGWIVSGNKAELAYVIRNSAAYWTMGRHWSGHLKATISVSTLKVLFQELNKSTLALGFAVVRLSLLVLELEQEN